MLQAKNVPQVSGTGKSCRGALLLVVAKMPGPPVPGSDAHTEVAAAAAVPS